MASIFPQVGSQKNPLDVIGMFRTKASDKPGTKVKIMPGTYLKNATDLLEFTGGLTPTFNYPTSYSYYVLVGIDENGIIKLIYGTESATPVPPKIPTNFLPSSYVFIKPNDDVISDDMIVDARELFNQGDRIIDHDDVTNRTAADSHTIGSITDLSDILDDKVDEAQMATSLNNLSLLKADVDGTTEAVFTLNKDVTGNVTELSKIVVGRGSGTNVEIGFDPSAATPAEEWYYITKDGNTGYLGVSLLDIDLNSALTDANLIDGGSRDFSTLFEQIITNELGITTLTTNLATTNTAVTTNTSSITTLTTNLASAVVDIGTNTTGIATLTTNLATTDGIVTTNTTNIGTNTSGIAALVTNLATTNSNIATNVTNIATNVSGIATLTTNLATTDGNVATNTTNIGTLTTNLSTHTHTSIQTPAVASFNATAGDRLLVNTAVTTTVVLPATPSDWEEVIILDKTLNFASVNLVVDRNASNINGAASNLTLSVNGNKATAIYSGDATQGWNIIVQ